SSVHKRAYSYARMRMSNSNITKVYIYYILYITSNDQSAPRFHYGTARRYCNRTGEQRIERLLQIERTRYHSVEHKPYIDIFKKKKKQTKENKNKEYYLYI